MYKIHKSPIHCLFYQPSSQILQSLPINPFPAHSLLFSKTAKNIFIAMLQPQPKRLIFQIQYQQSQSPYQSKLPDIYTSKFQELRTSIIQNLQEFIPIDVVPRPPPAHYIPTHAKVNRCAYYDSRKNRIVEYPRKNAFQVYVDHYLIFSRLETGGWPDVGEICEWALRVAEKMVDLEIQKEEATLQDRTKEFSRDDRDQAVQNAVKTERLPPVSRAFDRTVRTKPEKAYLASIKPRSRYASLKVDDESLPYGIDPFHNTRRKMPVISTSHKRKQFKSIDKEIRTVPRGSRSQSRDQSFHWHQNFHWHLKKQPEPIQFKARQNQIHINTFQMPRAQNVELTPLPAVNERFTEQRKDQEVKEGPVKVDVKISESNLNCYLPHYKLQGNKLTKEYYDQVWSIVLCQNPLPLTGEYYFHIIVKSSKENQIQVGIAPLTYYPRPDQPYKPDPLLSYNCGLGQIKDSKHNNFASETNWREGGMKVELQPEFHLLVVVNMKSKVVEWHVNEKIVASAKMPAIFNNGFRPFVGLYHCKDIIMLNDKVHKIEEPKVIGDLILNKSLMVDRDEGPQHEKTNVFVQTIEHNQPALPLPVLQNRIYANSKVKEQFQAKIDESVQTIPTFQGRIKRQRLQRIVQKQLEEEKKRQEEFNRQDLQALKKSERQEVVKKEVAHIVHNVHKEKKQELEPTETIVSPSIRDQQPEEVKEEAKAVEQPELPEQKQGKEEKQDKIESKSIGDEEEVIQNKEVVEEEQVSEDRQFIEEPQAIKETVELKQQQQIQQQRQIIEEQPPQAQHQLIESNQQSNQVQAQQIIPAGQPSQNSATISNPFFRPLLAITAPEEAQDPQPNPLSQSQQSSQNPSADFQWTATYNEGSFRLEQAKPLQQHQ